MPDEANAIRSVEALVAAAGASLDDLSITTALLTPTPDNVAAVATVRIPGMGVFELQPIRSQTHGRGRMGR